MGNALYGPGEAHARSLIHAGKVNESPGWDMTPDDENKLLGDTPDWTRYASWHLGHDESQNRETKAAWKYPFGKDGEVYRSALRAAASRAGQQGDAEISKAASALITEIDKAKEPPSQRFDPDREARRVRTDAARGLRMADRAKAARAEPRSWFRVRAAVEGQPEVAELEIFDEIGGGICGGVTAADVIGQLKALPESARTIRVRVASPGGDVWDALLIANALRAEARAGRTIEVSIEGLAASAATIITSAGDTIAICDNAVMMIHNPSGVVIAEGPVAAIRGAADEVIGALDRVRQAIIATYRWVSPLPAEQLGAMLDAVTWMNPDEAIANGFATEIVPGVAATARFDRRALATLPPVPDRYREILAQLAAAAPMEPDKTCQPGADGKCPEGYEMGQDGLCHMMPPEKMATQVARACRETGFPELVEDLLGLPLATVRARLEAKQAERNAADRRAREIRAACETAKFPDLAETYIRGGMALAEAKAQLVLLTAKRDAGLIDPHPPEDRPRPSITAAAELNPVVVYGRRNAKALPPAKGA